ncbi:EcoAI/FtnUII family type I restriction enzme subunit R [uncultured Desulfovibrio sp.]|uniref:EcoAI/FtnUII family type I restriction enzme subunit R n=1 Tax=uncultured Desulfovibrio sp. TaxID=167968 RepID=UPI00262A5DB9|nr:DEAD/DEAH box helicase family protein [uncultured Desulfovibrio sp.]
MATPFPLSEEDTKLRYITPDIMRAGWDIHTQIRMEYYFTEGRVVVHGTQARRMEGRKADYLLSYRANMPLAIVEAKRHDQPLGAGMTQAVEYAARLDIPFAYSSNGRGFLEHDMLTGRESELPRHAFPSPEALWQRLLAHKSLMPETQAIVDQPWYFGEDAHTPRYYQRIAVNRAVEAIARGQKRLLLVMATGTGKTYTAFQIIYRLWKSGARRKVLFLADRNFLVDQTMNQDFRPFGNKMHKIVHRRLDSAYEIYLALYQQLAGDENEEPFRQFQPGFFDLIIVDECHRGSARENSRWRRILDYFSGATQIGLTATPRESEDVSTSGYFGPPVYTYSLRQGIDDGFLAPYKVIRVMLDKDLDGWRPGPGVIDDYGNEIEDRDYNVRDYDRNLIIDDRTLAVARRVSEFLKDNDRFAKTIVFCANIDHAERMRQALVNENADLVARHPRYVMRITGDNPQGKAQLDNFLDPDSPFPVIVTTSRLLTTGADCKTCKLIVLDNVINSMTEFKQIIGRGSRLRPENGKWFFTIMDFRDACRLFADPDFDGDPLPPDDPALPDDPPLPDDPALPPGGDSARPPRPETERQPTPRIHGVDVSIVHEQVQYYGEDGKLVTESLIDYSRRNIRQKFATLDTFLHAWNVEARKQAIVEELSRQGVPLAMLREVSGKTDIDDFDLICHIAFDQKPLTRAERAARVRKRDYLHRYSEQARAVLSALLDKYQDAGISQLEDLGVLALPPFNRMGSPRSLADLFGGRQGLLDALRGLEAEIYAA